MTVWVGVIKESAIKEQKFRSDQHTRHCVLHQVIFLAIQYPCALKMRATPTSVVLLLSAAMLLLCVTSSFAKPPARSDAEEDPDFDSEVGSGDESDVEKDPNYELEDGDGPDFETEDAPDEPDEETDEDTSELRSARSGIPANCEWSACQGLMIMGQNICNNHGAGYYYVGYTKKDDCKWDTSKSECCKAGANKRWGKRCFGTGYLPVRACQLDFGHGVVPTGKQRSCRGLAMTQYECGN